MCSSDLFPSHDRQSKQLVPELLIVDSIQTVSTESIESSPGSVGQIRECTNGILKYAKENMVPVILIGHITKEGSLAGPKVLEHIVDTVLQFEGENQYMYRILRAIKNRFGSTSELGIFEMGKSGMIDFLQEMMEKNPSIGVHLTELKKADEEEKEKTIPLLVS